MFAFLHGSNLFMINVMKDVAPSYLPLDIIRREITQTGNVNLLEFVVLVNGSSK